MKNSRFKALKIALILVALPVYLCAAQSHPSLLMSKQGVAEMRSSLGKNPLFDSSLAEDIAAADRALAVGITVPEPVDGGGGASHEKHKENYYAMYYCGIAYQITGEQKYAELVRDMLKAYADVYPSLGYHPVQLSKTPGRIFWQTLNECVWLIHASIGYDCVYDFIGAADRKHIENRLIRPMAEFIMEGTPDNRENVVTFNKMHNHGTWATTAVGMAGLVIGEKSYVNKALYGTDETGKNGGFMMQMDHLFSPDGYFTEGAYYQRYSIWPFMLFAQALDNSMPGLKVFEYRDNILEKALDVLIQLAYDGEFMKINDSMEKGYDAQELIYAVDIIYKANPSKKELLSVAGEYQKKFLPTDAGYTVARDLLAGQAQPIRYRSVVLTDGPNGDEGAVAIIRSQQPELNSAVVMKATSHGLSHGHYDKLNILYFDNGHEILKDYGAARFHNIEAKYKGHYTPENKSFAMSTIAHNTLVVDGGSHYGGDIRVSSQHNPDIYYASLAENGDKTMQVVSAIDKTAYPGVTMHRTTAYIETGFLQYPLIVDLMRATSDSEHTYELPFWYNGHMISLSFPYEKATELMGLFGRENGYEHIWLEAQGKPTGKGSETFTWFLQDRFYSLTTAVSDKADLFMVRAGANDPNYHIRPEPAYIIREKAKNHTFASAIETHGTYNTRTEQAANVTASVTGVEILVDNARYTVAEISFKGGEKVRVAISNNNADESALHTAELPNGQVIRWTGVCGLEISELYQGTIPPR